MDLLLTADSAYPAKARVGGIVRNVFPFCLRQRCRFSLLFLKHKNSEMVHPKGKAPFERKIGLPD
jgi:hypothetical protein